MIKLAKEEVQSMAKSLDNEDVLLDVYHFPHEIIFRKTHRNNNLGFDVQDWKWKGLKSLAKKNLDILNKLIAKVKRS